MLLTCNCSNKYTFRNVPGGAHRASQILLSLADSFSVIPYSFSSSYTVEDMNSSHLVKHRPSIVEKPNLNGNNQFGKIVPPCSVQILKDLAIELKLLSLTGVQYNYLLNSTNYSLLQELNTKLINQTDKLEFKKQIEASKTIGKEVATQIILFIF